jgi:hypothetical protein
VHAEPEAQVLADDVAGDVVRARVLPAAWVTSAGHVQQQELRVLGERHPVDVDLRGSPPAGEPGRVVVADPLLEGPRRELVDVRPQQLVLVRVLR